MSSHLEEARSALESLFDLGYVSDILFEVKSGKEATVHCCKAGPAAARAGGVVAARDVLVAAKVYRPLEFRGFRNDSMYLAGRVHMARGSRVQRAAANHSEFGKRVQLGTWIEQEWATLGRLHAAGADVPRPIARAETAILLPFICHPSPESSEPPRPAPLLDAVDLDRAEAGRVLEQLIWNIELMLDEHIVHGDLSPFNVLYDCSREPGRRAVIIDFPQSVDPRLNASARMLLSRDIENICRWASRRGVACDAARIAGSLWRRFEIGEIG